AGESSGGMNSAALGAGESWPWSVPFLFGADVVALAACAGEIVQAVVLARDVAGLTLAAEAVEVVLVLRLAHDLHVEEHRRMVLTAELGALAGILALSRRREGPEVVTADVH